MSEFDFKRCPSCGGYGVHDNGNNCRTCGGRGKGGLHGTGTIGSGEIIIETATGRRVPHDEFAKIMVARGPMRA